MYLGPDTAMPLATAIAAITGVAVMFWSRTKSIVQGFGRFVARQFSRLTGRQ